MADPRNKFEKSELLATLEAISSRLDSKITIYLIGGLAMIFHGVKTVTKDVDIIFDSEPNLKAFLRAATATGMKNLSDLPEDYEDLNAYYILDSESGIRLDVFFNQVCNALVLSEGMKRRAKPVLELPNITIRACSKEDIFLFKSITLRDDDLEDMSALAEKQLDWNTIDIEIKTQPDSRKWMKRMLERLMDLEDDYGITSPL